MTLSGKSKEDSDKEMLKGKTWKRTSDNKQNSKSWKPLEQKFICGTDKN